MKVRIGLTLAALIGVCGLTNAQANTGTLSGETASPVPVGSKVTLRIEATGPMSLFAACPTEVRSGSPTGPVVWRIGPCIRLLVIVGPGAPYNNMSWPGTDLNNNPVGPGTYHILFEGRDANTRNPLSPRWVPVRLDPVTGPTAPILKSGAATRGAQLQLKVGDPNTANATAPYGMAASLGTNTGATFSFGRIDLDLDALFFLTAGGGPLTTGFSGNLSGGSAGASLFIPSIPQLQGAQVAVQCVVLGTGGVAISNSVQKVIG